jgi:hypothetical protein
MAKTGVVALAKAEPSNITLSEYEAELAADARADVAKFKQPGASRISFESGTIKVNDQVVGASIDVVIIEAVHGKAYYPGAYVSGKPQSPACYGFSVDDSAGLVPHAAAPSRQHEQCTGCVQNRFGTSVMADGSAGKGKRCKDEVRILCAVGDTNPESLLTTEVKMASIPPTSLQAWGRYVAQLADVGLTFRAVLTRISIVPPTKGGGFALTFTAGAHVSPAVYAVIKTKRVSAVDELTQPYPALEDTAPKTPPKSARARKF